MGEHLNTISDSRKQVDASNKPIKDTDIIERIRSLSVGVGSVEPAVIRVGIIGQCITQGVINRRTNIGSNLVTDILTVSSKILFNTSN